MVKNITVYSSRRKQNEDGGQRDAEEHDFPLFIFKSHKYLSILKFNKK